MVASVCILLRLAELGGQCVGATQLRLQVRDTSKVGTVLQLEKFITNHFFSFLHYYDLTWHCMHAYEVIHVIIVNIILCVLWYSLDI